MAILETFSDELGSIESFDRLNEAIVGLRDILETEHVIYHWVNSTGEHCAALTYSEQWTARYLAQDYARIDPVVQACLRRFDPVDWKRLDWSGRGTRVFMDEAVDAGVGKQGYSIPIRGPSGQFALFTVSSRDDDATWDRFIEARTRELILISHYIHQKALELERGSDHSKVVSLSPRETDALTLLALGRSRAQAAESLSISEHTLRVYIEGARLKLSAMNTTHAVARALNQGLLIV